MGWFFFQPRQRWHTLGKDLTERANKHTHGKSEEKEEKGEGKHGRGEKGTERTSVESNHPAGKIDKAAKKLKRDASMNWQRERKRERILEITDCVFSFARTEITPVLNRNWGY